ncbi:MAG: transcriptional repressor [Desulfomonile tiedjei]|nr:transcriptional repressor [Desulfomonile tiedjei]
MAVSPEEVERRIAAFAEACRSAGIRMTHQRMEIYKEVAATEEHPDAETIYTRVRRRIPVISLDTVYRTLTTLEKLGVVSRVYALCDRSRFDAHMAPHHHFLCIECGIIRDFSFADADELRIPKEVQSWGTMKSVHVEVRAACLKCTNRKKGRP